MMRSVSAFEAEKSPLSALVILGCRVESDGAPSAALERRLERGLAAFTSGVARRIVVSGGQRWGSISEAECMRAWLVARGVPSDAVVIEGTSRDTLENARRCAEILGSAAAATVGLVTCDWHMRRARACFRRSGLDTVPFEATSPEVGLSNRLRRSVRERIARRLAFAAEWTGARRVGRAFSGERG
jgi:SanA protein